MKDDLMWELIFEVCHHGQPCTSSHMTKEEDHLHWKNRKFGGHQWTSSPCFFLLAETLGKESFFFLLSSDIITVCENYLSWFPNSNWGFCLLIFLHTLPFWILDWDTLVIKSQITRRKRNRNLIAYKRSIYMGEAQENWVTLPNDPSYYLSNISSSR